MGVAERHLLPDRHRREVRPEVEVESRLLARRTPAAVALAAVQRQVLVRREGAAVANCGEHR